MIAYWILFSIIILCALLDIKKTIIVWIPLELLFNDAVALKYSNPVLSLTVCVNLLLPVIFFLKLLLNGNHRQKTSDFFFKGPFILYVISYALSIIFSIVPISASSVNTLLKFFCTNFIVVYTFQLSVNNKEDIRLFLKTLVLVLCLLTIDGLYELITKDNPVLDYIYMHCPDPESIETRMYYVPPFLGGSRQMRYGLIRAYSFFGIHIAYGCTCVLFFFLTCFMLRMRTEIISKSILALSVIMSLIGVVLSNSKTPLVGIVFFVFAFFSLRDIIRPKIVIPILICLILTVIYAPSVLDNFISLLDSNVAEEGGGSSVALRKTQLDVVKRLFLMNPLFGNGIGSIKAMYDIGNNSDILGAESVWFQILPERGLFGCFVYVYWYITVFKKMSRRIPRKILFFFLAGILVMETATGYLNIALYSSIVIILYKYYSLCNHDGDRQSVKYDMLYDKCYYSGI